MVTNKISGKSKCLVVQEDDETLAHPQSHTLLKFQKCGANTAKYHIQVRSDMISSAYQTSDQGESIVQPISNKNIDGKNDACYSTLAKQIRHKRNSKQEIKIAFFIRGHDNTEQTMRLMRRIYSKRHVYLIHYDQNSEETEREKLYEALDRTFGVAGSGKSNEKFSHEEKNVYILTPREVDYMGFNLLMLDIAAMRTLLNLKNKNHLDWEYFINLSATEYPLISLRKMENILLASYGNNFIDMWCPYNLAPKYKKNRIDLFHMPGTMKTIPHYNRKSRHPVPDSALVLGSFYVVLTKKFCQHLFSSTKIIELLTYMPGVKIPDELFFSTAISSSKQFLCTHVNTNFRYTNWGRSHLFDKSVCSLESEIIEEKGEKYLKGGSHPCILGSKEVEDCKLTTPLAFFGNKFDINLPGSLAAMNKIDEEINRYENSIIVTEENVEIKYKLTWIERGWPHPLHCANYHGAGT